MSLEDLGNIGELVGAIAVVASLVYLAAQIRQNTRQITQNTKAVKVASADSHLHYGVQFRGQIIQDAEVARLWRIGMRDRKSLDLDARVRFDLIMANVFFSIQNRFFHSREGIVLEQYWEAWEGTLQDYIAEPGVQDWWARWKRHFALTFMEHVDALVVEAARQSPADESLPAPRRETNR